MPRMRRRFECAGSESLGRPAEPSAGRAQHETDGGSAAAAAWRRWAGPTPSGRDLAYLAVNLIVAGDVSGGREALRQALMRSNTEYVREDLIANAFMRLGDREPTIQWLVKGAASNVGGIEFSLEDSLYAPIRSDPRIQAIIERLKVRWAHRRAAVPLRHLRGSRMHSSARPRTGRPCTGSVLVRGPIMTLHSIALRLARLDKAVLATRAPGGLRWGLARGPSSDDRSAGSLGGPVVSHDDCAWFPT
jgi:hypothetical protein